VWNVAYTDEFNEWFDSLNEKQQDDLRVSIQLLIELGPNLPRPYADTIEGSYYSNMKELRTQSQGRPLRTFFAFDPKRCAILLIGGDKTGNNRFYKKMIPLADEIFSKHLKKLKSED
jgi:hypothetical protein